MRNIYVGVEIVGKTPIPGGQPLATGPLEEFERATGTGISQLSSRVFAVQSGRLGHKWMAIDLGSRLANRWGQKKADALMYEALFGEEIARDLSLFGKSKTSIPAVEKRINGYIFNLGLGGEE